MCYFQVWQFFSEGWFGFNQKERKYLPSGRNPFFQFLPEESGRNLLWADFFVFLYKNLVCAVIKHAKHVKPISIDIN